MAGSVAPYMHCVTAGQQCWADILIDVITQAVKSCTGVIIPAGIVIVPNARVI
jgi:hypothetical protein